MDRDCSARRRAKEVALTSDPNWRAVIGRALAQQRTATGENLEPANILGPALQALLSATGSEVAVQIAALNLTHGARRGAVRLSAENERLALRAVKKMSTTMAGGAGPSWSVRNTVLAALFVYAKALLRDSESVAVQA
jgi:hypothetical protein